MRLLFAAAFAYVGANIPGAMSPERIIAHAVLGCVQQASSGLHNSFLWPLLPCLYVEEVGGEWSYIFLFSPTFTFISWPSFNSIFHK